jgi:hypothetical protein
VSRDAKKMTRTELCIFLNAHRGGVDLALRSLTIDELWQLVFEMEAQIATKLEIGEVASVPPRLS